jgi:hypothetical protein
MDKVRDKEDSKIIDVCFFLRLLHFYATVSVNEEFGRIQKETGVTYSKSLSRHLP